MRKTGKNEYKENAPGSIECGGVFFIAVSPFLAVTLETRNRGAAALQIGPMTLHTVDRRIGQAGFVHDTLFIDSMTIRRTAPAGWILIAAAGNEQRKEWNEYKHHFDWAHRSFLSIRRL